MLNISINKESTVVQNAKTHSQWTMNTTNFFGIVYAALERNFPGFDCSNMANIIVERTINKIAGQKEEKPPVFIFDCEEIGTTLFDLIMFVDNKKVISPTLKDIEELRISHRMTTTYLPVSINDRESMRFEGLKTVTQVMIAALYYYAYFEYKLTRCKHCGKWFATKSLKKEYCDNISPCYGLTIAGKKVLGSERACGDAVGIIVQRLKDRKKQIYNKWYIDGLDGTDAECTELNEEFTQFMTIIKESPTVENITACMEYLYSDRMPKQERPNRRKANALKRELKKT